MYVPTPTSAYPWHHRALCAFASGVLGLLCAVLFVCGVPLFRVFNMFVGAATGRAFLGGKGLETTRKAAAAAVEEVYCEMTRRGFSPPD